MDKEELNKILKNHQYYLDRGCDDWENMRADLRGAGLVGVDLTGVDLSYADLRNAGLRETNLIGAHLYGADLRGANLEGADLSEADLREANLCYTKMNFANLTWASLDENEKIRQGIILTEPMTGWKKCANDVLVKLEIPAGAIVFSINNSKCRTNKAIVKEIIGSNKAISSYKYFSYYVGDIINIKNFNCQYNVECAEGIHFFRTQKEAENY